MKKRISFLFCFIWIFQGLTAQEIPFDSSIRTAKLSNGLTYYLKKNQTPEKRAELRLVVKIGSVVEEDNEQGLAHFLEHMAFNGTKKYPKNELVSYLQGLGMQFGADLNAHTAFEETVYKLQVPTDKPEIIANGIEILSEWAHNISLEDEEINKERGIILEEKRARSMAGLRIFQKQMPVYFNQSKFANRLPIGTEEVLKNFPTDVIRQFYKKWYRPDLQAIVVVGDIDLDVIENQIKTLFGQIPAADSPNPLNSLPINVYEKDYIAINSDEELPVSQVAIRQIKNASPFKTVADFQQQLLHQLFNTALSARLQEITKQPNPPFAGASAGTSALSVSSEIQSIGAVVLQGKATNALQTIALEQQRAVKHGFLATEFERAKTELLSLYTKAATEAPTTDAKDFVEPLADAFINGHVVASQAWELDALKTYFAQLNLGDFNAFSATKAFTNAAYFITVPKREGVEIPTEAEVSALITATKTEVVAPYTEEVSTEPLLANLPTAGKTVRTQIGTNGTKRLFLSNGIQVVLKPTTFKNDEILIQAVGEGGDAVVSDADYHAVAAATSIVINSGAGNFDAVALSKKLAGKNVAIRPYTDFSTEGFSGNSTPEDLETAFQLIYLYATQPRFDALALQNLKQQQLGFLANKYAVPFYVLADSINTMLYENHFRKRPETAETINALDLEKSERFYKDRFGDFSDFTFYFVGNFDETKIKQLAETYLASLPTARRIESEKDLGVRMTTNPLQKSIKADKENRATLLYLFKGTFAGTQNDKIRFSLLSQLIELRLLETLRENMSGVYTPSTQGSINSEPWGSEYQIEIFYACDPARATELENAVMQIVNDLKTKPITTEELRKLRMASIRSHETNIQENGFWLDALQNADRFRQPLTQLVKNPRALVNAITSAKMNQMARMYLNTQKMAKFALLPQE